MVHPGGINVTYSYKPQYRYSNFLYNYQRYSCALWWF